jgi:acyl-CoA reductase-like NAD-dependent aldehyde dehydrogenase
MLQREYGRLYIDGRWQTPDSTARFDVVSPHSGQVIGHVPNASRSSAS